TSHAARGLHVIVIVCRWKRLRQPPSAPRSSFSPTPNINEGVVCPCLGCRRWRSIVDVQTNWWENFFEGVAVTMWLQALPAEHTQGEADRLARLLAAPAGAEILDVPCGAGRLALALAERGYRLTGVDWSSEFLGHARSRDALQQVTWERRDMRNLPWPERFD